MRALSSASDSPVPKCDGCARSPHWVSWKWEGWYKSPGGPSSSSSSESSGRGPPARVAGWEARDILSGCGSGLAVQDRPSVCSSGCPHVARQRRRRHVSLKPSSRVLRDLLSGQGTVWMRARVDFKMLA